MAETMRAPAGLAADPEATAAPASRPARVCIVSYEFTGPTRTGGIGTAYTSLAEALAGDGHEVTVLFTGWAPGEEDAFERWAGHYGSLGIGLERLERWSEGIE
ncbi:MAG: glycogen/starch synthase, partial [Solirubrobacterales bacterium]